jgi:hypothetical protein
MKTREEVEAAVRAHMPSRVLADILTFVRNNPPALWGLNRGRAFLRSYCLLALYKDITSTGYDALYKEVGSWLKSCPKTLRHNTQVLCLSFAAWGKTTVHLGSLEEWQRAASPLRLKGALKDVCLWIDSFDLALEGKKTTSRKGPDWSHKKNGPGRRYMAIQDAHGRFRALWGEYSPKVWDGEWLCLYRAWIESSLAGATMIGDQHFEGGKTFNNVNFITPIKRPTGKRKSGQAVAVLTKAEEHLNHAIHTTRARVELGFGRAEAPFQALQGLWKEDDEQLTALVWLAVSIANTRL